MADLLSCIPKLTAPKTKEVTPAAVAKCRCTLEVLPFEMWDMIFSFLVKEGV